MNEIKIPKKLDPIIKAFCATSRKAAKELIIQAAKAIYGDDEDDWTSYKKKPEITPDELEGICALIQGIKPNDMLEALYAAQIVVSHMLGLRKLATGHQEDTHIGLKILQFSSDAISRLQRKRGGCNQNINVTYVHSESGPTLVHTVLPSRSSGENPCQSKELKLVVPDAELKAGPMLATRNEERKMQDARRRFL